MTGPPGSGFYARPGKMTAAGHHAPELAALPDQLTLLTRIVQGVLIHEHLAQAYGEDLTPDRRLQSNVRPVEQMLEAILTDGAPLSQERPPGRRLVGVCRHFALLLVAMLRAKAVAARARCGFGAYFETGRYIDHWVCEYWNAAQARWVLVDAQIDERQTAMFKPDFDLLDVPRDMFVVAGDAWRRCRAGEADPAAFGMLDMRGLWFVSGNVVRDFAALNNMEMLPWDVWGAMAGPDQPIEAAQLGLLDDVAALTLAPGERFDELRALYDGDDRLRVPPMVRNAVLNRMDSV